MKKAEALSRLLALIDEVPDSEELEEVLAVLSVPCPTCEGEKPLAVVECRGEVDLGPTVYLVTNDIIVYDDFEGPADMNQRLIVTITERESDGDSHT